MLDSVRVSGLCFVFKSFESVLGYSLQQMGWKWRCDPVLKASVVTFYQFNTTCWYLVWHNINGYKDVWAPGVCRGSVVMFLTALKPPYSGCIHTNTSIWENKDLCGLKETYGLCSDPVSVIILMRKCKDHVCCLFLNYWCHNLRLAMLLSSAFSSDAHECISHKTGSTSCLSRAAVTTEQSLF